MIMGNDELIYWARKHGFGSNLSTAQIGRKIWVWIRKHRGCKVQVNAPCRWPNFGASVNSMNLPKTATQFRFDSKLLPQIYKYLKTI